jgi:hypothetical protein
VVERSGVAVVDADVDPDPQAVSVTDRTRTASAVRRARRKGKTTASGTTPGSRERRAGRWVTRRIGGVGSLLRHGMSHGEM